MRNLKILVVSLVTLSRPVLAGFSAWHMLQSHWLAAWMLFVAAAVTDLIDGRLARSWDVVTKFGTVADYVADTLVFWAMVPTAYYCSQLHSVWAKEYLDPITLICVGGALLSTLVGYVIATGVEGELWRWWLTKGNFWIGVVPVTCVGLFMAYQVGWWAVALSLGYLSFSCWFKWEFLKKML